MNKNPTANANVGIPGDDTVQSTTSTLPPEFQIAAALTRLATIAEKFFEKLYPEKAVVRDADLAQFRTPQQQELDASIQGEEETLEQWKELGPREAAFLEKQKKSS